MTLLAKEPDLGQLALALSDIDQETKPMFRALSLDSATSTFSKSSDYNAPNVQWIFKNVGLREHPLNGYFNAKTSQKRRSRQRVISVGAGSMRRTVERLIGRSKHLRIKTVPAGNVLSHNQK